MFKNYIYFYISNKYHTLFSSLRNIVLTNPWKNNNGIMVCNKHNLDALLELGFFKKKFSKSKIISYLLKKNLVLYNSTN